MKDQHKRLILIAIIANEGKTRTFIVPPHIFTPTLKNFIEGIISGELRTE